MEQELTSIRVAGVPEHFNLPWMLGMERRAFVRAGIDLQWRTVPEGTGAMCELLRAGEVDMAVLVTEGAVRDILNGNPSRIVSTYVDSPLTWGVHVGANTALRTPAELVDVPFAISRPNSGSHLVALNYAKRCGWLPDESDFEVVHNLKNAVARLQEKDPLVFLWDAAMTSPYVDQGLLRRVDSYAPPWPCFVVVAREAAIAAHRPALHRTLKVVRDQARGLMEKKQAPEMIAQRYGMSVEAAKEWFSTVRWNLDGRMNAEALEQVAGTLRATGLITMEVGKILPALLG